MAAVPLTFPIKGGPWSGTAPKVVVLPLVEAGAAGTYTSTMPIKAGTKIMDVSLDFSVAWAAGTSATLDVGDTNNLKGYMNDVNLKTTPSSTVQAVSTKGGSVGVYTDGRYYPNDDVLTLTVVTVGTTSSAGRSYVTVVYSPNIPALTAPTQA